MNARHSLQGNANKTAGGGGFLGFRHSSIGNANKKPPEAGELGSCREILMETRRRRGNWNLYFPLKDNLAATPRGACGIKDKRPGGGRLFGRGGAFVKNKIVLEHNNGFSHLFAICVQKW